MEADFKREAGKKKNLLNGGIRAAGHKISWKGRVSYGGSIGNCLESCSE